MSTFDVQTGKKVTACTEPDCEKPAHARGMCPMHYLRARREGSVVVDQRTRRLKAEWELDTSGERCRCGLRLPCGDCLPTRLHDFIEQRMHKEPNA